MRALRPISESELTSNQAITNRGKYWTDGRDEGGPRPL